MPALKSLFQGLPSIDKVDYASKPYSDYLCPYVPYVRPLLSRPFVGQWTRLDLRLNCGLCAQGGSTLLDHDFNRSGNVVGCRFQARVLVCCWFVVLGEDVGGGGVQNSPRGVR